MDRLAFTSLKSVTEQRVRREMLTNELANVSTVGFKRSYESALRAIKVQGPGFDSRLMPVLQHRDVINLEPGVRMVTGRKLDVALDGSTVMGVTAKNGDLAFTRRGDLRVSPTGVLENGEGVTVRGQGGAINVPQGFEIEVLVDGTVVASDPNAPNQPPQQIGQILLRDASAANLGRREDGLFKPYPEFATAEGDFANGPIPPSLSPAMLEGSNVSPIEGMVRMLDQNRSFETQIRIIKETRNLDESGASMLRPGR
jgi:flagellar basal-body rod protein FlgF